MGNKKQYIAVTMGLMIISLSFVSLNVIRNNPKIISKIYHATRLINNSTVKFYNDNLELGNYNTVNLF